MMPGHTLHRLAALMCCAKTLERVVEPAIADLQKEYASAGRFSRRAWVLLRGYFAIVKVIVVCAMSVSTTSDERQAISRTFAWSVSSIAAISALLTLPPLLQWSMRRWDAAITVIPQALPLAIPMGIAIGIAFGLGARPGRNIVKVTLLAAVVASAVSFGILAWVIPVANQAFSELADSGYKVGFEPEKFSFAFHLRFALAAATLALVSLLLAVPFHHRGLRGLVAVAASFGYLTLLSMGESLAVSRALLPPVAAAWMPNVVLIALAIAVASSRFNRRSV